MAARVLILGGYGTFGRLLAREVLDISDARVVIAGRDQVKAEKLCQTLGARTQPLVLDLFQAGALREAAAGCSVVACAAGPFQTLPQSLIEDALDSGAHWADIADTPAWVGAVLENPNLATRARDGNLGVVTGASSVPALSGALVRWATRELPDATRARVTLSIGNRNDKGAGSIASALAGGFRDPISVRTPFGVARAFRFDAASFPSDIDTESRVALQFPLAARAVALLGRSRGSTDRARRLSKLTAPLSTFGTRNGCVQAEVFAPDGRSAAWAASMEGQRLAIIPCALAIDALLAGELRGVVDAAAWLSNKAELLRARGVRLLRRI